MFKIINKAVILAAGLGSRLKPLTAEVPKCLTEVNGEPILLNTLKILEKYGVEECLVVIGYLGEVIIKQIGPRIGNMKITFLENKNYEENNSMYSAWIGREFLEQGCFLIEGDCVFEEELIRKSLAFDPEKSCWILDHFAPEHDGSMSIINDEGRIIDWKLVQEKLLDYKPTYYKSTGIVKITPEYGKHLSRWLDEEVKQGNIKVYYDNVIAKHLHEYPLYACDITGSKWFEIDDFDDLKKAEKMFSSMKFVIVIMDGATDHPVEELNYKTPLEIAHTPHTDSLAKGGKTGMMRTMHPGLPIGSIVANMGILGYNPARYYPQGRSSFEALAQDIFLKENDIAFRCNLISLEDNKIKDFTASQISNQHARKLINNLKISHPNIELYPGQSYRNILIFRNAKFKPRNLNAYEPHENIGQPIQNILMNYHGEGKEEIEDLNKFMLSSVEQIKEINKETPTKADMIWLWSPSFAPRLPSFHSRFQIDGAVVTGIDFMRGIATAARMESKKIQGATGYLDTDLKQKLKYAKNFLRYNDLVYIHINSPDEEGHNKSITNKIQAIENIDQEIIGPIIQFLEKEFGKDYRIAIMSDHHTLVKEGTHSEEPVPYLIYGKGIAKDQTEKFTESEVVSKSQIKIRSDEFMELFIKSGRQ